MEEDKDGRSRKRFAISPEFFRHRPFTGKFPVGWPSKNFTFRCGGPDRPSDHGAVPPNRQVTSKRHLSILVFRPSLVRNAVSGPQKWLSAGLLNIQWQRAELPCEQGARDSTYKGCSRCLEKCFTQGSIFILASIVLQLIYVVSR